MGVLTPQPNIAESAIIVEEMFNLLDKAAAESWETYLPLWTQLLSSVRATVGIYWEGVWPTLTIGYPDDGDPADVLRSRMAAGDGLFEHLRLNGWRSKLLESVIGDREGTSPSASLSDIRRATNEVILDYLATQGRILITPAGDLTESAGLPHDYLCGDSARDAEIERATKAYTTAKCCRRAAPIIREWVQHLGADTSNGWRQLEAGNVEWWAVHLRYRCAAALEQAYDDEVWTPAWKAAGDGEVFPVNLGSEIEDHMEELQEQRCSIEGMLFAIPSPSAAAFAVKVKLARARERDASWWDHVLIAEAERFAAEEEARHLIPVLPHQEAAL